MNSDQSDARWMLHAPGRPMVWPFDSREAAQDWADDHGLIDHKPQPIADAPEHEAICARCREPWPCHAKKIDREVATFANRLRRVCTHCGEEVKPGSNSIIGDGMIFHTARSRHPDCRAAAAEFFAYLEGASI